MKDIGIRIGSAFRRRREYLNYTQTEVANWAGITSATVSHIEGGHRFNNISTLDSLAAALETQLWKIFRDAARRVNV